MTTEMLVKVEKVSKIFSGFQALKDVNMEVTKGEICSVIGTNGAGKTTLFNVITGHLRADAGEVFFKGIRVTKLKPHSIVHLGIGRSFQCLNIFLKLTAFENVQAAVISHHRKSLNLILNQKRLYREEVEKILEEVRLSDIMHVVSGSLSYGYQKQLELGIALAFEPELLMLDEPMAGLSASDSRQTMELIVDIAKRRNTTLLIVEHDMHVVFTISTHIIVLHQGQVICDGSPEQVRSDENVQNCYLGETNDPRS